MDGRIVGWIDGQMDRRMDGGMDNVTKMNANS